MNISRPPPTPVNEFIGFRVECQSVKIGTATRHRLNNNGGIYPDILPTEYNFWGKADNHMSWRHVNSSFVSFFRTWGRAMHWRKDLIEDRGGMGVRIIAVWLKGLTRVYDAHKIARSLGYPSAGPGVRPRLENHEDELLVEGGIDSGYRVLAIFNGDTLDEEDVSLSPLANSPERLYGATIPRGSLPGTTATESLRDEMYSLMGTSDDLKLYLLVLKMRGATLKCPPGSAISCGRVGFVYGV
ncbi:hypothetical protein FIE12Z_5582 [Fusarium flagelliforme]|uniref:DUF7587 domain-containing protein n=1 Tax=Fusarium flagelliforme TaxID=2675880 RepID=A0A395MQE2_9HYPO|nr:hypothetical protein FIE12Z_5582 [Fusarium flagelliforme]